MPYRILFLTNNPHRSDQIRKILKENALDFELQVLSTKQELSSSIRNLKISVILTDTEIGEMSGNDVVTVIQEHRPDVPVVVLGKEETINEAKQYLRSGITDYLFSDDLWKLPFILQKIHSLQFRNYPETLHESRTITTLIRTIQNLSKARKLQDVIDNIKHSARLLVNSDGATFVLRDGDESYYADEDAIAPLWKGKRFSMRECIGGWAMLNREQVIIEDVYKDSRIPYEAYMPTFIKSLVMTPVRKDDPIAAIGVYWATHHKATSDEVTLLQTLAETTSVALENVQLLSDLENRVEQKTKDLHYANKELEAFSFSLSHDLRAPLRAVDIFSRMLTSRFSDTLPPKGVHYLNTITTEAGRMEQMIEDMLKLFKLSSAEIRFGIVNLSEITEFILKEFREQSVGRKIDLNIQPDIIVYGDRGLLTAAMQNLLSNAWKFSFDKDITRIHVGSFVNEQNMLTVFIKDNGAGFDSSFAQNLFEPFRRLHTEQEFPGTGVGLAIVKRIIEKHGGKIWAESIIHEGSVFSFTLHRPKPDLQTLDQKPDKPIAL